MSKILADKLNRESSNQILVGTCLILKYHRVSHLCYDPLQWSIEPYKFESQMEYLANNCNVISIDEMYQHIKESIPFKERTVVVTFDGGYADILYTAKDVLEQYNIHTAVFSTSANIIKSGQLWWDKLEDYFVANDFLGQLEIEIDNNIFKWSMETKIEKFRAYYDLYSILVDKSSHQQQDILDQIVMSMDLHAEELDSHRTMNAQQIKELDKSSLITIGGHTHNGVNLSSLDQLQQAEEILKNKVVLEEILDHKIKYFSHLFGGEESYGFTDISKILMDNNFDLVCGNAYSNINLKRKINLYDLPRVKVGNWNQIMFHKFLERFWT